MTHLYQTISGSWIECPTSRYPLVWGAAPTCSHTRDHRYGSSSRSQRKERASARRTRKASR